MEGIKYYLIRIEVLGILLRNEIIHGVNSGKILLDPYNVGFVGPNSVDVTLNKTLKTYTPLKIVDSSYGYKMIVPYGDTFDRKPLDMAENNQTYEIEIPEDGVVLLPGILYLGMTNEAAGSDHYVPMYEGRSSLARLGIQSHISAGFGDIGFDKKWTLEITVVHPVRIYPNSRIGQVYFHEVNQDAAKSLREDDQLYKGKYVDQDSPTASMSFLDFTRKDGNKITHVAHR